ncbi:MAG: hypothetical protein PHW76_08150 [Alphaproteobacteria bacterium]|nr:hypothetical protein [Alphaproteobacteria bacterium]
MMNGLTGKKIAISVLAAIIAGLGLTDVPLPKAPHSAEKRISVANIGDITASSANAMEEILARPLFHQSRRPPEEPEIDAPAGISITAVNSENVSQVVLFGTSTGPKRRAGLIKWVGEDKTRLVHEGETVNGWIVQYISPKAVTLKNGDDVRDVQFSAKPTSPHADTVGAP